MEAVLKRRTGRATQTIRRGRVRKESRFRSEKRDRFVSVLPARARTLFGDIFISTTSAGNQISRSTARSYFMLNIFCIVLYYAVSVCLLASIRQRQLSPTVHLWQTTFVIISQESSPKAPINPVAKADSPDAAKIRKALASGESVGGERLRQFPRGENEQNLGSEKVDFHRAVLEPGKYNACHQRRERQSSLGGRRGSSEEEGGAEKPGSSPAASPANIVWLFLVGNVESFGLHPANFRSFVRNSHSCVFTVVVTTESVIGSSGPQYPGRRDTLKASTSSKALDSGLSRVESHEQHRHGASQTQCLCVSACDTHSMRHRRSVCV